MAAWRNAGFDPIAAPLLTVNAVVCDTPLDDGATLIFTSANGVRHCPEADRTRRVYCIGPATARAANEAGFSNIVQGSGDWNDLLQVIDLHDSPFVHIGGRYVRGRIAETLRERGVQAERRVVYASEPVFGWPVNPGEVSLCALYSPLAAKTLLALPERSPSFDIVALSEAVAAPIRERFAPSRVHVASAPTDGAMMEAARFAAARDRG